MKSRTASLIAIAVVPAAVVGALLWWLTGFVPECSDTIVSRLDSPDASRSLMVFTRDCGTAGLSTQAVIMPAGGTLEGDATGFLALEGQHDLAPRWDGFGNIELSIPEDAEIYRQDDTVAGVTVIYR